MARRGLGGYLPPISNRGEGRAGHAIRIVHLGIDHVRMIEVGKLLGILVAGSDPPPIRFRFSKLRDDNGPASTVVSEQLEGTEQGTDTLI